MISRIEAIARRRAVLVDEIEIERGRLAMTLDTVGRQLALATMGIMVGRLLGRSRWLRIAAVCASALSMAGPLLARFFPARPERP